jgi:hypothetical protein
LRGHRRRKEKARLQIVEIEPPVRGLAALDLVLALARSGGTGARILGSDASCHELLHVDTEANGRTIGAHLEDLALPELRVRHAIAHAKELRG